jgi:hypothetical protein
MDSLGEDILGLDFRDLSSDFEVSQTSDRDEEDGHFGLRRPATSELPSSDDAISSKKES